jgi:putative redox protein
MAGPRVDADLEWGGALRLSARTGSVSFTVDSDGVAGPSPVQALAAALAGCMAIDVVHILTKGRLPLRALRARLEGERAAEEPRRLLAARLHFLLEGAIPEDKIERAIALSREKYCSVWHSLRQDIAFETSFEVKP